MPITSIITLFNKNTNDAWDYGFAIVASSFVTLNIVLELIAYRKLKEELKED